MFLRLMRLGCANLANSTHREYSCIVGHAYVHCHGRGDPWSAILRSAKSARRSCSSGIPTRAETDEAQELRTGSASYRRKQQQ